MSKKQITWLPIVGSCKIDRGVLKYIPTPITEGENTGKPSAALIKSNQMFESGVVTLRVKIEDPESKVQVGFSHGYPIEIFAGLNIGSAAYGIATFSNNQWDKIGRAHV